MYPAARREQGASGRRGPEGGPLLAAWDRYARLLDEQVAVLQGPDGVPPDLARFHAIARDRSRLADEIDAMTALLRGSPGAGGELPGLRERMADCRQRDRALLERLSALRDHTSAALRTMNARRPGRDGYLARVGNTTGSVGRRFDVRS